MSSGHRLAWAAAALGALGAGGLIAHVSLPHDSTRNVETLPTAAGTFAAVIEGFCADELEPIEGGCFAPPRNGTLSPTPLLVYLHGRYSDDTVSEELDRQSRVVRLATARGFGVLALRGGRGECTAPDFRDWYCWPSNARNAIDGPAFVSRFLPVTDAARARLGPGPNVLLGFSNGGYFATLIATRALAPFDAIAIAHAGPVPPTTALGSRMPMLLITAYDDASDPEMQQLDDALSRLAWPHALVAREGGHALPDWDIEMALTFFTRVRKEKLPLVPPLASQPRPVVDALMDAEL